MLALAIPTVRLHALRLIRSYVVTRICISDGTAEKCYRCDAKISSDPFWALLWRVAQQHAEYAVDEENNELVLTYRGAAPTYLTLLLLTKCREETSEEEQNQQ